LLTHGTFVYLGALIASVSEPYPTRLLPAMITLAAFEAPVARSLVLVALSAHFPKRALSANKA